MLGRVTNLFLIRLLILAQEVSELLVISQLSFLHRDNQLDVPFEIFQVVHEKPLLLDKLGNLSVELLDLRLR